MNGVLTTLPITSTIAYYTSHNGYNVPVFNGSRWSMETFAADLQNLNTDATYNPAATVANNLYDLFIWMKSGVMTLSRGPIWTNLTTRALGLQRINGIWTNASAITNGPAANQGTYVGTVITNASNNFVWNLGGTGSGGVAAWLGAWNYYNRVRAQAIVVDNGGSYSYSTSAWRAWRNSSTNYIGFVTGVAEDVIDAWSWTESVSTGTAGQTFYTGISVDSTSGTALGAEDIGQVPVATSTAVSQTPKYQGMPGTGWHVLYPTENGGGTNWTANAAGSNYFAAQIMS